MTDTKIIYVLCDGEGELEKAYENYNDAMAGLFRLYVNSYNVNAEAGSEWIKDWNFLCRELGDLINLGRVDEVGYIYEIEMEVNENEGN